MTAVWAQNSALLRTEAQRWGLSLVAVLGVHVAGAAALLSWRIPHDLPASPPAVVMELAPVISAPTSEVSDVVPGPRQEVSEPLPQPDTPVEPPIETEVLKPPPPEREQVKPEIPDRLAERIPPREKPPAVVLELPPPKPPEVKPPPPQIRPPPKVEKPPPRKPEPDRKPRATQTTAPPAAPAPQASAAAPPPGQATQPSPDTIRRWQSTLLAHLQRHKRYPTMARNNNEEGTAYLRVTMDRSGRVLAKRLERASGHGALDRESLDLMERAQPLPAPPVDMPGERFEIVVPIQFQLR